MSGTPTTPEERAAKLVRELRAALAHFHTTRHLFAFLAAEEDVVRLVSRMIDAAIEAAEKRGHAAGLREGAGIADRAAVEADRRYLQGGHTASDIADECRARANEVERTTAIPSYTREES